MFDTSKIGPLRAVAALALGLSAMAVARPAGAQEAGFAPAGVAGAGFGTMGQWVLSGEANGHLHRQNGGGWQVQLQPALDTFIITSVSVGGYALIAHDSGGTTTVGLGARAGYSLPIMDKVTFWPLGGVNVSRTSDSMAHTSSSAAALHIFAPFLYHIVPHFFAGLGPSFDLGLSDDHQDFGIDSIVGGWF